MIGGKFAASCDTVLSLGGCSSTLVACASPPLISDTEDRPRYSSTALSWASSLRRYLLSLRHSGFQPVQSLDDQIRILRNRKTWNSTHHCSREGPSGQVVLDEARSLHVDFRHLPGCFFNGYAEPLLYDLDSLRNGRNHAHAQSRSCRQDLRSPSAHDDATRQCAREAQAFPATGARRRSRKSTIFTGVSGSGKSSLVFDTLASEAQRRLYESLRGARGRLRQQGRI